MSSQQDQDFHALVKCAPKPESRTLLREFVAMMANTAIKGGNLHIDLSYDEAVGLAAAIEDFLR
jgi:hypothetical protein